MWKITVTLFLRLSKAAFLWKRKYLKVFHTREELQRFPFLPSSARRVWSKSPSVTQLRLQPAALLSSWYQLHAEDAAEPFCPRSNHHNSHKHPPNSDPPSRYQRPAGDDKAGNPNPKHNPKPQEPAMRCGNHPASPICNSRRSARQTGEASLSTWHL